MANIRDIKRRMKAVSNIKRITKTMQMIATVRFQAALRAATDSHPYTQKIAELVGDLAAAVGGQVSHPLLRSGAADGRRLLLVITSNRGLCGGYNASILRTAKAYLSRYAAQDVDVEVVGKKGVGYFRFTGTLVTASFTDLGDKPAYEQVEQFAEQYMQKFKDETYAAVDVAHMSFQSVARQSPTVLSLLPLDSPAAESTDPASAVDYEFSPDPGELLDELLPASVKARLFQCFNEAVASEQIARMVAMKNATDAASKMSKQLTRSYNRARQTAITTELSEIIGGAAALQ